jgi:hypothetical protein
VDVGVGIDTDDRGDDSLLSNTNYCLANVNTQSSSHYCNATLYRMRVSERSSVAFANVTSTHYEIYEDMQRGE